MSVNAETAGERAYRRIRRDILFGGLAPAQKLKLDGLKESYGISISTLRELLNRLSSEGLIIAEGARGFEVAPISPENLKEVANLRQLLECHAMELSFAAGDMEWEGRVVAAHQRYGDEDAEQQEHCAVIERAHPDQGRRIADDDSGVSEADERQQQADACGRR